MRYYLGDDGSSYAVEDAVAPPPGPPIKSGVVKAPKITAIQARQAYPIGFSYANIYLPAKISSYAERYQARTLPAVKTVAPKTVEQEQEEVYSRIKQEPPEAFREQILHPVPRERVPLKITRPFVTQEITDPKAQAYFKKERAEWEEKSKEFPGGLPEVELNASTYAPEIYGYRLRELHGEIKGYDKRFIEDVLEKYGTEFGKNILKGIYNEAKEFLLKENEAVKNYGEQLTNSLNAGKEYIKQAKDEQEHDELKTKFLNMMEIYKGQESQRAVDKAGLFSDPEQVSKYLAKILDQYYYNFNIAFLNTPFEGSGK